MQKHPTKESLAWKKCTRKTFVGALDAMRQLSKVFRIPIFLQSGTLLGWRRTCDFLPHTTDSDYGALHEYGSYELGEELKKGRLPNVIVVQRYGFPSFGLEYQMFASDCQTDLFFLDENDQYYLSPLHFKAADSYTQFPFPKFNLCSSELHQRKVLIPCEPEKVLEVEYGPDWRTPVLNYGYNFSATLKGLVKWNETLRPHYFRHYWETSPELAAANTTSVN